MCFFRVQILDSYSEFDICLVKKLNAEHIGVKQGALKIFKPQGKFHLKNETDLGDFEG